MPLPGQNGQNVHQPVIEKNLLASHHPVNNHCCVSNDKLNGTASVKTKANRNEISIDYLIIFYIS